MGDAQISATSHPVLSKQLIGLCISSAICFFFGGTFPALAGIFTFIDAWKSGIYKHEGTSSFFNITPMGWGISMQFLPIVVYPLYLINRNKLKTKEGGNTFYILIIILGGICIILTIIFILSKLLFWNK